MLLSLLIFINVIIFSLISLLHFYWAFGGKWGSKAAIPDQFHERAFNESGSLKVMFATIIVALGLMAFAAITLSHSSYFNLGIAPKYIRYATWAMAFIFTARAIGDFNIVGFFKKKRDGLFAEKDSSIYSPLCLYLGVSLVLILVF